MMSDLTKNISSRSSHAFDVLQEGSRHHPCSCWSLKITRKGRLACHCIIAQGACRVLCEHTLTKAWMHLQRAAQLRKGKSDLAKPARAGCIRGWEPEEESTGLWVWHESAVSSSRELIPLHICFWPLHMMMSPVTLQRLSGIPDSQHAMKSTDPVPLAYILTCEGGDRASSGDVVDGRWMKQASGTQQLLAVHAS